MGNLIKGTPYSEITATLELFDRHGVSREHLHRLRSNKDHAKCVIEAILHHGLEKPIYYKEARAILADKFFGPEEWSEFYGVKFTKEQLCQVANFPWSEDTLNSPCPFVENEVIRDSHFAFLGIESINDEPLNLLEWSRMYPFTLEYKFSFTIDPFYDKPSTQKTCQFRWYLMLLGTVSESIGEPYVNQVETLPLTYEVPSAIETVTKYILHSIKTNDHLCSELLNRCRDPIPEPQPDAFGLDYDYPVINFANIYTLHLSYRDGHGYKRLGITASRKLPETK